MAKGHENTIRAKEAAQDTLRGARRELKMFQLNRERDIKKAEAEGLQGAQFAIKKMKQ